MCAPGRPDQFRATRSLKPQCAVAAARSSAVNAASAEDTVTPPRSSLQGNDDRTPRAILQRWRTVPASTRAIHAGCVSSLTCQSWRLVRSQKSTASLGSKSGSAIVCGSKSHAHDDFAYGRRRAGCSSAPSRSRDASSAASMGRSCSSTSARDRRRQRRRPEPRRCPDVVKLVPLARAVPRSRRERSFGKIVAPAIRGRKLVQLRMHERAVIAFGVVLENQLPIQGRS